MAMKAGGKIEWGLLLMEEPPVQSVSLVSFWDYRSKKTSLIIITIGFGKRFGSPGLHLP
jgi:hypothetical protein